MHDKIVVDASVALKWFLQENDDHYDKAIALLVGYPLIQPPHFIAEVAAVLARKKPIEADQDLADLLEVEMAIADEPTIYQQAIRLSIDLNHHLFDTLYHAVALETKGALLITADNVYYAKAKHLGRIKLLADVKDHQ
ncbi:type II toxin-antitoxin system VapC family toxin [Methyloglobulus sp.]|uniref:type II toxin-antitoxin system VapC family toxin n=1 Tax=Methyloglobulus sp. TaxID=2518622 RepID=UPI0032B846A6